MTSQDQDTERKWAGPTVTFARAICCPEGCAGDTGSGWPCDIWAEDATSIQQANAVIAEALRHGWVNPQFMDALKAEKSEASTPGKARNT